MKKTITVEEEGTFYVRQSRDKPITVFAAELQFRAHVNRFGSMIVTPGPMRFSVVAIDGWPL